MSHLWEIPELWPGSTVYIIGGGPSLLDLDLSLIHDKRVIGVNQAYKLGAWVDVCWYGDKQWYPSQFPMINDYKGLIVTCSAEAQEHRRYRRVKYVGRGAQSGLVTDRRTHIAWNGNSGASAINVAYWLGAKRIVLLGFDAQLPEDKVNGRTHWHDDYERRFDKRRGQLVDSYSNFMKYWPILAKHCEKIGLEVFTTTQESGLKDIFPYKPLEELI
jgi:uncharacterized Rossmann fold enzyme